jgi:hypothetical protein
VLVRVAGIPPDLSPAITALVNPSWTSVHREADLLNST